MASFLLVVSGLSIAPLSQQAATPAKAAPSQLAGAITNDWGTPTVTNFGLVNNWSNWTGSFDKDALYGAVYDALWNINLTDAANSTMLATSWNGNNPPVTLPVPARSQFGGSTLSGNTAYVQSNLAIDSGGLDHSRTPTLYFGGDNDNQRNGCNANAVRVTAVPETSNLGNLAVATGAAFCIPLPGAYTYTPTGVDRNQGWSGYSINQQNGHLYLAPNWARHIAADGTGDGTYMIFDPAAMKVISPPTAVFGATNAGTITGWNNNSVYVGVQGAIDANGIQYTTAGPAGNQWLIKLGAPQSKQSVAAGRADYWTWAPVAKLWADKSDTYATCAVANTDAGSYWGMAFINGLMYAGFDTSRCNVPASGGVFGQNSQTDTSISTAAYQGGPSYNGNAIYTINPLSGKVSFTVKHSVPGLGSASAGQTAPTAARNSVGAYNDPSIRDVASLQNAPVISGYVYSDPNGNGDTSTPVQNSTVALYQANSNGSATLLSVEQTSGDGSYSFLLPNTTETAASTLPNNGIPGQYYVRVVQPQVNGRNAVQTWASGNQTLNTVSPQCGGVAKTDSGTCVGNLPAPYVDKPATAVGDVVPDFAGTIPIYTKVTINTAGEVADAVFGVGVKASYGDAPAGPTTGAAVPLHNNASTTPANSIQLGDKLGAYDAPATTVTNHASDDGLFLATANGDVPLQGTVMSATKQYQLAAVPKGGANCAAQSCYLSMWTTGANNNTWSSSPVWPTAGSPTKLTSLSELKAPYQFATSGTVPASSTVQLRASVSLAPQTKADNSASEYQAPLSSTTANWTTPGEIEDYSVTIGDAVYRPAAITTGGTIPGNVTFNAATMSGVNDKTTTFWPAVAASAGSKTFSVTPPDGNYYVQRVDVEDTTTGNVLKTFQGADLTLVGNGVTFSYTFALGEDLTILATLAPNPSQANSTLTLDPADGTVPAGTPVTATAHVADADGNPLAGVPVTFANKSNPTTTLSDTKCTTGDGNNGTVLGECSVTITSNKVGTYKDELSATVPINGANAALTGSPKTVTFTQGAADPAHSSLAVTPAGPLPVGTGAGSTYTATVTTMDANDNLVAGAAVGFTVTHDDGTPVGPGTVLSASSCQTSATSGAAYGTCQVTLTSKEAGSFKIHATVPDLGTGAATDIKNSPATVVYQALPTPEPLQSSLTVTPAGPLPVGTDAASTYTATVTVKDTYGNLIPGASVAWTVTNADGSPVGPATNLSAATCQTIAVAGPNYGTCVVALTSQTAGKFKISAKVTPASGTATDVQNSPATVEYSPLPDPDPTTSELVVTPASPLPVGSAYTATTTVRDKYNNPIPGQTVTYSVMQVVGGVEQPAPAGTTLSTTTCPTSAVTGPGFGACQATVTSSVAGTFNIHAKVGSGTDAKNSPAQVEFQVGKDAWPTHTTLSVTPATALTVGEAAANTFTATTTAKDKNDNLVPGVIVQYSVTKADGSAVDPAKTKLSASTCTTSPTSGAAYGTCFVTLTSTEAGSFKISAKVPDPDNGNVPTDVTNSPWTVTYQPGPVCSASSGLSVDMTSAVVVTGSVTATVNVKDCQGNPVADGTQVNLALTGSAKFGAGGSGSSATTLTSVGGKVSVAFSDMVAEKAQVSATVLDATSGSQKPVTNSPVEVEFKSTGIVDPGKSTFTVAPTSGSANPPHVGGTESWTATITAKDAVGNPVTTLAASDVAFAVTFEGMPTTKVSVSAVDTSQADKGIYTAKLTSNTAWETYPVTAKAQGQPVVYPDGDPNAGQPVVRNITFQADATPEVTTSTLAASPTSVTIPGSSTATVTMRDQYGNLTNNPAVVIRFTVGLAGGGTSSATLSAAQCSASASITDPTDPKFGTCSVSVSDKVAEKVAVDATMGGTSVKDSPAQIDFNTDLPPAGDKSTFTVAPTAPATATTVEPDGTMSWTATVTLKDEYGNALPGKDPALIKLTPTPVASPPVSVGAFTDQGGGVYTAKVTSLVAGTFNLTAAYDQTPIAIPAGQPNAGQPVTRQVTFTALTPYWETSSLSVDHTSLDVGQTATATVTAKDQNNNLVGGYVVNFAVSGSATTVITPSTKQCTTNNVAGNAAFGTCSVTITDTNAGEVTVHATVTNGTPPVNTDIANSPQVIIFNATDPDPNNSVFTLVPTPPLTPTTVVADGTMSWTADLWAKDARGNELKDLATTDIAFHADPAVTVSAVQHAAGSAHYTATLTSTTAGKYDVTAAWTSVSVQNPATLPATFVAGAPASGHSSIAVSTTTPATGDASSAGTTATVTVKDANDNLVGGASVPVAVTGSAVLTPTTCVTNNTAGDPAFGTCQFKVTDAKAEQVNVSATLGGQEVTNSPVAVTFQAGQIDPAMSYVDAQPPSQTVGANVVVSVYLRDANGNPLSGYTQDQFQVTGKASGLPDLAMSSWTAMPNGQYTYNTTSQKTGTFTFAGTVGGMALTGTQGNRQVEFTAGDPCLSSAQCAKPSTFTVTLNDQTANGVAQDEITAQAYDIYGNVIPGASVKITDTTTAAGLTGQLRPPSSSSTTDANGVAVLKFATNVAGTYSVQGTINGLQPTSGTITNLRFSSGTASRSTLAIVDSAPFTVANAYTAKVTVLDASNNPVAGATATFTSDKPALSFTGDTTGATTTCTTGQDGTCTVTFTTNVAGTYQISSTVPIQGTATPSAGSPATVVFGAGQVCVQNDTDCPDGSYVAVTRNGALSNGTATNQATVYARDMYGNGVNGVAVTTSAITGDLSVVSGATGKTASGVDPVSGNTMDGIAQLTYSSTTAGDKQASVTVAGQAPKGSPVTLTFQQTAVDPGNSTLTVTPDPATNKLPAGTDAGSTFTATATAKDAAGRAVPGAIVSFSVANGPALSSPTCTTGADGTCQVTISSTKVGDFAFGATVPDSAGVPQALTGSPKTLSWTAGPMCTGPAPCQTRVDVTFNGAQNDGVARDSVTVYAFDAFGNPITGAQVTTTADAGMVAQDQQPTPTAISPIGADGTSTIWYTATTAGTYQAHVSVNGVEVRNSPVSLIFGTSISLGQSSWQIAPAGPLTVGTTSASYYTLTVTARGENGAAAIGAGVQFSVSPTTGVTWVNGSSCTTGNDGTCQVQVYSTHSGPFAFEARSGLGAIGTTQSRSWNADAACVPAAPGDPNCKTKVEVTTDNATANGTATDVVTVSAFDQYGNPVPGALVASAAADPAKLSVGPAQSTDENGVAKLTYRSTVAGAQTAQVSLNGASLGNVTLNFKAGAIDPTKSTLSATPATQAAGSPVTVNVTLRDSFGNPLDGYTADQFAATATAGVTGVPDISVASFASSGPGVYTGTTTSQSVGKFTFSGMVAGVDLAQHPQVEFTAGPICLTGTQCDKPSYFEVTRNDQVADGVAQDEVTAHAFDIYGNPMAGASVKVSDQTTASGLAGLLTPAVANATTGADGTVVVRFATTKMGTYTAEGLINGQRPQPSGAITNLNFRSSTEPAPQNSNLTVSPISTDAGSPITATAVIRDANRNPIEGAVVTFGSGSANVTFNGTPATTATCQTDASGSCSVPLTSLVAGSYQVTAKVPTAALPAGAPITGSPADVTFTAGPLCMKNTTDCANGSEVVLVSDGALSDGVATNEAIAYARDKNGNGVNGVTVTTTAITPGLSVVAGASGATATVNINGVATTGVAKLAYASTIPGTGKQASVTIDGNPQTPGSPLVMSFIQTAISATNSTLEVTPASPITAGSEYQAKVTVRDATNNPVEGAAVSFASDNPAAIISPQTSCQTGADGTCQVTVAASVVAKANLQATVNTPADPAAPVSGSPKALEWVVGQPCLSGTPCNSKVQVTTDNQSNDGIQRDSVTVWVYDANNNPVPGVVVASVAQDPSVLTVQPAASIQPTDANGVTTIWYTSATASGPQGHMADVTIGGAGVPGSPVALHFGKPLDQSKSSFTVTPSGPLTVGDQAANMYTLTMTARDTDDHALPGSGVTFSVTQPGTTWVGGVNSCQTGLDGTCKVQVYSTVAGSFDVTAKSGTSTIGSAQQLVWKADAVCVDASCKTYAQVTDDYKAADGTQRDIVTVWAYDRYDNPVGGAFVSSLAGADVSVQQGISSTALPDGNTTIWYTSKVAGAKQVSVSVEGHPLAPLTINFTPGAASAANSALSVDTAAQSVGGNVVVTGTVKDANGNPIPGVTVTFGKTGSAQFAETASCVTGDGTDGTTAGVCQQTLTDDVAEDVTLTASVAVGGVDTPIKNSPLTVTFTNGTPAPIVSAPADGALTNAKPLPVSGTGAPGQTVTVTDQDGHVLCSASVASDGTWTCDVTVPDGNYTLTAVQKDAAGNPSPASQPVLVSIDTAAPAVPAIATPVAGPANNPTPTVSGTKAEPGTTVTVTDGPGGPELCTATVTPQGNWSCTVPVAKTLDDGPHTLTAVATDAAGNHSDPATTAIDVDTQAPDAPAVTAPTPQAQLNDAQPPIAGTGEDGATVTITDGPGGPVVCGPVAVVDGTWSCTPSKPLGEGPHTLSATQTDPAGNTSPATTTPVVIDTKAPAAPVVNHPGAGQPVPSATPSFDGTAEPGSTVTVADASGNPLCQAIADANSGAWSCTPTTPFGEGSQTVSVTATDPAGNVSDEATQTFTVDTQAPVAPVVNTPAPGDQTKNPTPTVSGTGETGATVSVTDENGNVLCTATVVDGSWSCTPPANKGLDDGDHTLNVTQTDPAGNVSPTMPVPFTVDTTSPSAPKIDTANATTIGGTAEPGATVTVTVPGVAKPITVVADPDTGEWSIPTPDGAKNGDVTVTATDAAGNTSPKATVPLDVTQPSLSVDTANASKIAGTSDDPTAKIVVTWPDGTTSAPVQVNPDGTFSVPTPPGMPSGPITVTATDPAGNMTSETAQLNTDKPGAPAITTANAAKVAGTASIGTPLVPGSTVVVTWPDGSKSDPVPVDDQGNWSIPTPAGLPSGQIKAVVTDPYGNVSPEGTAYLDTRPPVPPVVTKPADGQQLNDTTPEVAGTAEPGSTVTVSDEQGNELCTATADPVTGAWSCKVAPGKELPDGEHTLSIVTTDPAGNPSDATQKTITIDTQPPVVPVVTSPKDGTSTNNQTPTLAGTGEPGATVTVTDGPNGPAVCTTTVKADGTWSCSVTTLPEGDHQLVTTQTDPAGNVSDPTTITVHVDTTPPDAAKVTKPAAGAPTSNTKPQLGGTAEPGATVSVTDKNGTPVPGCDAVVVDATGEWSCTPTSPLPEGSNTLNVVVTDPAGNPSKPVSHQFIVDTTPPDDPIVDPTNGSQVSGSAEPGATVAITMTDPATGKQIPVPGCDKVQADANGKFKCQPKPPLPDGTPMTVAATDAAGNASTPIKVTVGAAWVKARFAVVHRGEPQSSFGGRWVPGETITVTVQSATLNLGEITAGADGLGLGPVFVIPSDFAIGTHTITWTGSVSGVQKTTFKVMATPKALKVSTGGTVVSASASPLGALAGLSLLGMAFSVGGVVRWRR